MTHEKEKTIQDAIKIKYGDIARGATMGCGCASGSCCGGDSGTPAEVTVQLSTRLGYTEPMLNAVPESANLNLGCGNPQAIAELKEGETVLDLGSGAGFDCFLAARQVGTQGRVIGVDMTIEMVKKANENAAKGSYPQVLFQLGAIEHLPVPSESVDVIISNCVINLSPDKIQVFREAFRVLKPGGRLAISDVVAAAEIPHELREDLELYSACISGAIEISLLKQMLSEIGFKEIEISAHDRSREIIHDWAPGDNLEDLVQSASIKARK